MLHLIAAMVAGLSLLNQSSAPGLTRSGTFDQNWSCDAPQWPTDPSASADGFDGTVQVRCSLQATHGGTLTALKTDLGADLVKQAVTVYSGPTDESFEGLPSSFYDAKVNAEGLDSLRADFHIATDGKGKLIFFSHSTEIEASGLAANIREIDSGAEVTPGRAGAYQVVLSARSLVDKPGLVGVEKFKQVVMSQMESKISQGEKEALTQLGQSL